LRAPTSPASSAVDSVLGADALHALRAVGIDVTHGTREPGTGRRLITPHPNSAVVDRHTVTTVALTSRSTLTIPVTIAVRGPRRSSHPPGRSSHQGLDRHSVTPIVTSPNASDQPKPTGL